MPGINIDRMSYAGSLITFYPAKLYLTLHFCDKTFLLEDKNSILPKNVNIKAWERYGLEIKCGNINSTKALKYALIPCVRYLKYVVMMVYSILYDKLDNDMQNMVMLVNQPRNMCRSLYVNLWFTFKHEKLFRAFNKIGCQFWYTKYEIPQYRKDTNIVMLGNDDVNIVI